MKRLIQCSYNIKQIVNKLYRTVPLVPTGNLIQDIIQDIQCGLYKDCGDPNKHWNLWMKKCKELLKDRNVIDIMDNRDYINAMPYIDNSYGKISQAEKIYTWKEICNITNKAGGNIYSGPYGDYNDCEFELKFVPFHDIDKDTYLTIEECKEYDLDEDTGVIKNLVDKYNSGVDFPPIILDSNYKIIDGSHRMGAYEWLGLTKIKTFIKKERRCYEIKKDCK